MGPRVLLVDDHDLMRAGVRSLLTTPPLDCQILGEAASGLEAIRLADELSPDVVFMDISMRDMNGIEATRRISAGPSRAKIIIISMHAECHFIAEALKAGATGYVLKTSGPESLFAALRVVLAQGVYLSSEIAGAVVHNFVHGVSGVRTTVYNTLSARECEVLQLLAEGKSTKQIAAALHLSGKTVESHRAHIMAKLKLHSIAELTKYAIREGLASVAV